LQIHDELIFEVPSEIAHKASATLKNYMEQVITLKVPLIADAKIGTSWKEVH
jgi:DNA polymerase-1